MKSLKNSTKILLVMLLAATVGACGGLLGEKDRTYNGEAQFGFYLPDPPGNITKDTTKTYTIELIRSQEGVLEQPLSVEFTVVSSGGTYAAQADTVTTVPEASYDIQTPSPVTIPAGELETNIAISFNPSAIPSDGAGYLVLYIVGNEERGITGGANIGYLTLIVEGGPG